MKCLPALLILFWGSITSAALCQEPRTGVTPLDGAPRHPTVLPFRPPSVAGLNAESKTVTNCTAYGFATQAFDRAVDTYSTNGAQPIPEAEFSCHDTASHWWWDLWILDVTSGQDVHISMFDSSFTDMQFSMRNPNAADGVFFYNNYITSDLTHGTPLDFFDFGANGVPTWGPKGYLLLWVGTPDAAHGSEYKIDISVFKTACLFTCQNPDSRPYCSRTDYSSGTCSQDNAACTNNDTTLCLSSSRFKVTVSWATNDGRTGQGQAVPMSGDTGHFWFFNSANVELVIKVLDGRALNGHFWVFYGALSDVGYTITVRDTVDDTFRTYSNSQGTLASVADTLAF